MIQHFHGEYKIILDGKSENDYIEEKNQEYESNLYKEWIEQICKENIYGDIHVEKISYNFTNDDGEK
jgi:hypothetical protein